jgi:hypothetical protein
MFIWEIKFSMRCFKLRCIKYNLVCFVNNNLLILVLINIHETILSNNQLFVHKFLSGLIGG